MPVRRLTPGMVRTQIARVMLVTCTNIMCHATQLGDEDAAPAAE